MKKKAYVNTAGADDSSKRGLKVRKVGQQTGVLILFGTTFVLPLAYYPAEFAVVATRGASGGLSQPARACA